jgi:hypothetical protein
MRYLLLALALSVPSVAVADVTKWNPPVMKPIKPAHLEKIRKQLRKMDLTEHRDPQMTMFPGPDDEQTRDEKRGLKEPLDETGKVKR